MNQQPTKTHWKKLTNPDYLGAYDFADGEQRLVTVKSVEQKTIKSERGDEQEITINFVEAYKPMIINATNAKTIAKISGSNFIEDWTGLQFYILVKKVKAFGDVVDALRISSEKVVKKLPTLIVGDANFEKIKTALKEKKFSIDDVKKKYSFTKETEDALNG